MQISPFPVPESSGKKFWEIFVWKKQHSKVNVQEEVIFLLSSTLFKAFLNLQRQQAILNHEDKHMFNIYHM